jgi:hypothetical protein
MATSVFLKLIYSSRRFHTTQLYAYIDIDAVFGVRIVVLRREEKVACTSNK